MSFRADILELTPEHYPCYLVYVPNNCADCVAKIVQLFPHQCVMPAPFSLDVSTLSSKNLANALLNMAPASSFVTVGNETLRALTNLSHIFTTAITPTVASVPATSAPTLLVVTYPKVPASPTLTPFVIASALSLRVVPVSTPPLPHIIDPEDYDPVPRRRYPLRSHCWLSLYERGPHLIAAAAHHCLMCSIYLHPTTILSDYVIATIMQGCVNMTERVPSVLSPIM